MLLLPLRPVALAVCTFGAVALSAAEWTLPPVSGELSGDFTLLKVAGAPKLHWGITSRTGSTEDEREIAITLDGPGARVRATARVDLAGNGTWRIDEAEFDLGPWFPAVVPSLPSELAGLSLAGTFRLTGEGTWRDGKLGGRALVRLRDARIDDPAQKFLLEGVALELAIEDLAARQSPAGQTLAWKGGHYDVVALGAGRATFALAGDRLEVNAASISAFAGEFVLGAFTYSFAKPEIALTAQARGVELAMLLPYLPAAVSEAHGKLDGTVELGHDAKGVRIGTGRLRLRAGETAELRFIPGSSFLGDTLPPRVTKIYTGLADLEQGKVPFKAQQLEITFTPEGDAEGRTASVHLAGGPADPRLTAPMDFTVNVRGPLEWLVKFGTDSRLNFR